MRIPSEDLRRYPALLESRRILRMSVYQLAFLTPGISPSKAFNRKLNYPKNPGVSKGFKKSIIRAFTARPLSRAGLGTSDGS